MFKVILEFFKKRSLSIHDLSERDNLALGSLEKPEIPLGDCFLTGIQENVI